MTELEYNNRLFDYHGKLTRLAYILQNAFWNIVAAPFLYYPYMVQFFHANPKHVGTAAILKYIFYIPLRMIDIKRIRDIKNSELSLITTIIIVVVLSIPYVDFFSTFLLSLIPGGVGPKKSAIAEEIKKIDMKSAQAENFLQINKKLFESGKISRADYEKARDKYK